MFLKNPLKRIREFEAKRLSPGKGSGKRWRILPPEDTPQRLIFIRTLLLCVVGTFVVPPLFDYLFALALGTIALIYRGKTIPQSFGEFAKIVAPVAAVLGLNAALFFLHSAGMDKPWTFISWSLVALVIDEFAGLVTVYLLTKLPNGKWLGKDRTPLISW